MRCPDREFLENREIGKIREISNENEERQYNHAFLIRMHVLTKLHEKIMIFNEVRRQLEILQFHRAQIRDSEGPR